MKPFSKSVILRVLLSIILTTYLSNCSKDENIVAVKDAEVDVVFNSEVTYGTVKDIDGNKYKTIQIGNQIWMAENLRTTKFNDGESIPNIVDDIAWGNLNSPAYCWYNNDSEGTPKPYGVLYNWFAIKTGKLAPKGWHVASNDDWAVLIDNLNGGWLQGGGNLKETGTKNWTSPNKGANNTTGFTALPGGWRTISDGFVFMGISGDWWCNSATNDGSLSEIMLNYKSPNIYYLFISDKKKNIGLSVRCVKD